MGLERVVMGLRLGNSTTNIADCKQTHVRRSPDPVAIQFCCHTQVVQNSFCAHGRWPPTQAFGQSGGGRGSINSHRPCERIMHLRPSASHIRLVFQLCRRSIYVQPPRCGWTASEYTHVVMVVMVVVELELEIAVLAPNPRQRGHKYHTRLKGSNLMTKVKEIVLHALSCAPLPGPCVA